jgi:hypothetical protein
MSKAQEQDKPVTTWTKPPFVGDRDDREAERRELERDKREQACRYQIVRGARLHTFDGRVLEGLSECCVADFDGIARLDEAIAAGVVTEARESDLRHRRARGDGRSRYQVIKSIITKGGTILAPGAWLADDLSDFEHVPARPAQEQIEPIWRGEPPYAFLVDPGRPALAATPEVLPVHTLARYLRLGCVRDTHADSR